MVDWLRQRSATPHQLRKGIKDNPTDHWPDTAGFNGDLDGRDNAALGWVLTDAMLDTFRWLLSHGIRLEPPHKKTRIHNVLPNSGAVIVHLECTARRDGVVIRANARAWRWWLKVAAWSDQIARRRLERAG